MATPRFFVPLDLASEAVGQTYHLPEAVAHHATRVVRLGAGERLTLFTGCGGEFAATIVRVDKRSVAVRIDAFDAIERESPLPVVLAQAVAANDAMDYAIRKATEVGVTSIQPLVTVRSAPLPGDARGDKRHAHWRQVAIAACEQCGRNRVPEIHVAQPLPAWLAAWQGAGVVLLPEATRNLVALPLPSLPFALMIGPEGGWDAAEIAAVGKAGFIAVRLGPRVLRTETAGVAALAVMQSLWGDYR